MLPPTKARSVEFPRPKIFLSHLNQLIDKKIILQPEIEVNNKLFPQRDFAKRLSTSHQRTKSSIQLRAQRFDLHWTSKRTKNMAIENSKQPVVIQSNPIRLQLPRTNSTQFHKESTSNFKDESTKFYSTCTVLPHNSSPQSQPSFSNPASPQKNFLRRGSNIQKQIVINLLRNKLLREREISERREYSNSEIVKMIQVFKGVALEEGRRKGLIPFQTKDNWRKGEPHKELKGWENEPFHDYQMQVEKE